MFIPDHKGPPVPPPPGKIDIKCFIKIYYYLDELQKIRNTPTPATISCLDLNQAYQIVKNFPWKIDSWFFFFEEKKTFDIGELIIGMDWGCGD